MNVKSVYSCGTNLSGFGGAQKVLVDVHDGIKKEFVNAKIIGFQSYDNVNKKYGIDKGEYVRFLNPFLLRNSILILHARKLTTFFTVLNKLLGLRITIIYVSHNIYNEKKSLTILPEHIVSISDKVTDNLINYFGVAPSRIVKIQNGIRDTTSARHQKQINKETIKILYSARLTSVKRQVELVKNIKGKLPTNVTIAFAGTGPDKDSLAAEIGESSNFQQLGFVDDMAALIETADYLMLFSTKEGLPISLMEGTMYAKPLIANDVGGNLEIAIPHYNAFIAETWEELSRTLSSLPLPGTIEYNEMCSKSRAHYEHNFKYEIMIDKYIDLINRFAK